MKRLWILNLIGIVLALLMASTAFAKALQEKEETTKKIEYAGAVTRDPTLKAVTQKIESALQEAMQKEKINLIFSPLELKKNPPSIEPVLRLLKEARGRFFDADFAGAEQNANEGLLRFEDDLVFYADEKGWESYAELHIIRAMALLRLGDAMRADRTFHQLAVVRPNYVPDPGFVPPKVASRYARLRKKALLQKSQVAFTSSPAGAELKVDGVVRGQTPLTLKDLAFGVHSISLKNGAQSQSFRLRTDVAQMSQHVELEHENAALARSFLRTLKEKSGSAALQKQRAKLRAEMSIALVRRSEEGLFIALGKWNGEGVVVIETAIGISLNGLEQRVAELVKVSRNARTDQVLHGGSTKRARQAYLGQAFTGDDSTLLWVGIGSGIGAAAALLIGGGVSLLVFLSSTPNSGGTDFLVDASRL